METLTKARALEYEYEAVCPHCHAAFRCWDHETQSFYDAKDKITRTIGCPECSGVVRLTRLQVVNHVCPYESIKWVRYQKWAKPFARAIKPKQIPYMINRWRCSCASKGRVTTKMELRGWGRDWVKGRGVCYSSRALLATKHFELPKEEKQNRKGST